MSCRCVGGDAPLQHAPLPAAGKVPVVAVVKVLREVRPRRADPPHALRQTQEALEEEEERWAEWFS